MKLTRSELLENINKLNKQQPLKENKEIQRVASPADADALEQHEQALKQNKERLDPKNFEKDVKDLIQETASEESRYRHFDVVDRKDLAKRINEAKEKGLDFKVSRSTKDGFRYNLEVLNEDFLKKEAGDPKANCAAFNKATDIQASSPSTGLGEDIDEPIEEPVEDEFDWKSLCKEICSWIVTNCGVEAAACPLSDYLTEMGYDEELVASLFADCEEQEKVEEESPLDENLGEELKVYTSTLENFHPSVKCADFWQEIVDAGKVEDLEDSLETLYPEGISDVALDQFLSEEEDWVRDLINLPEGAIKDNGEEVEPVNYRSDEEEIISDDEAAEPTIDEPITDEEKEEGEEPIGSEAEEDEEIEPLDIDDSEIEEKPEEKAAAEEPKKELKEESLEKKQEEQKGEVVECGDVDDDKTQSLADSFVNKNFKENNCCGEEPKDDVKKQLAESEEADDEIVDVSEDDVDTMLGCPKKEKEK